MTATKKPILIVNIGNILLKDEGIGYHVAERIKQMPLPPDVEFADGGILGNKLLYYIEGRKKVIVIQMLKKGGLPGTIYRFTEKEMKAWTEGRNRTVPEWEFYSEVEMARVIGTQPDEMVFFGVEPEDTGEETLECAIELTPTLEKKVPEIIELVMKEIEVSS